MEEKISARGKINLTLNVLGRRTDGCHDLELIFQPVSLADELWIEEKADGGLDFSCSAEGLSGDDNLVCRGYRRMQELFPGQIPGLRVRLVKHIPSGAGMAGGSADCAALLVWLNGHCGLGMDRAELIRVGASLGADVPACMQTHAVIGHGIGEILTDIRMNREYPLLVVKPAVSFDTGEMFRMLDRRGLAGQRRTAPAMIEAMEAGDLPAMAENLYNVFEDVVPQREHIARIKRRLREAGALGSLMTGSGSAVYGIFADPEERDCAQKVLRESGEGEVLACEAVNRRT